jgi:hypothetical protein
MKMVGEMLIPRNEPGVFYLFSRFHEKLGFEEIIDVSTLTPDVIAKRNGKRVNIELEYKSSDALEHYYALKDYCHEKEDPREGKWIKVSSRPESNADSFLRDISPFFYCCNEYSVNKVVMFRPRAVSFCVCVRARFHLH